MSEGIDVILFNSFTATNISVQYLFFLSKKCRACGILNTDYDLGKIADTDMK